MNEEEKPIRVVDRRMFTPDGELRPDFQAEEPPEPPKPPPAAPAPAPSPAEPGTPPAEGPSAADAATSQAFIALVSFLASNVYAALGIDPMTGERLQRREPAAARQMIDWLGALEQKTRGQLSFEESDLLSRVLYELRMAYVEVVRPPGPGADAITDRPVTIAFRWPASAPSTGRGRRARCSPPRPGRRRRPCRRCRRPSRGASTVRSGSSSSRRSRRTTAAEANRALDGMMRAAARWACTRLSDFSRTAVFLGRRAEKPASPSGPSAPTTRPSSSTTSNPDAIFARLSFLVRHGQVLEALRAAPGAALALLSTHESRVAIALVARASGSRSPWRGTLLATILGLGRARTSPASSTTSRRRRRRRSAGTAPCPWHC